jgi:O-antigen/teichoic acid export membrane protein
VTGQGRRPLVEKSAWSTAASVATALGNVATSVVIARVLGPAGTGQVAYVLWLVVTCSVVAGLGLPACLQRYVAELHGRGRDAEADALARRVVRTVLGVSAAAAAIGVAAAFVLAPSAVRPLFLAVAGLFLLQCGADAYRSYLVGVQRFSRAARISLTTTVVQIAATAAGAAAFGVRGALAGAAAALLVPAALGASFALRRDGAPALEPELRTRVRTYALDTWLAALVSLAAWSRLEVAFLEPSWGEHGVAMFTTALALATLASQAPVLLAGALLPHMAERAGAGDLDNVRRTYASATRILGALVLPMCLGAAAVSPALVPFLYGGKFADAVPAAAVLCAASAIGAIASAGSSLVYAMERSRFIFLGGLVGAAMAIAGYALVIPASGPLGAACTRSVVQAAMVALGTWYILTRLKTSVPFGSLVRSTIAASLCAATAYACVAAVAGPLALAVAIPAGAAVYALAARALHALEPDDVRMIGSAVAMLPPVVRPPFAGVVRFVAGRPA